MGLAIAAVMTIAVLGLLWRRRARVEPGATPPEAPELESVAQLDRIIAEMEQSLQEAQRAIALADEDEATALAMAYSELEAKVVDARHKRDDLVGRLQRIRRQRELTREMREIRLESSTAGSEPLRSKDLRERQAVLMAEAEALQLELRTKRDPGAS